MSENELKQFLDHLHGLDQCESQCNVGRNDIEEYFETRKKSMGFIASFLNCGIIVGFSDSVNHEGPRKITDHLLTMVKLGAKLPNILVYDAACQLSKFWKFRFGGEHMTRTSCTQKLMDMIVVSDRFHNTVHKGELCKTIFNPDFGPNKELLSGVNTSIAEQTFSYLTRFKCALRSFSYPTSALFTILLFHLKNCDKLNQSPSQTELNIGSSISDKMKEQALYQNYCIFEMLEVEKTDAGTDCDSDDGCIDLSDHGDDVCNSFGNDE
jgi:hypothetical protein